MWANMYKAYAELSPAMREFCEGLSALHDADPHGHPERTAVHPVVRVHPETGRKSLFVNEHFTRRIVELGHEESAALLGFLTRWVTSPRFTVRYHWTAGTIAMWDNRCTQHHVLNDFDGERVIQRVTIRAATTPSRRPPPRSTNGGADSVFARPPRGSRRAAGQRSPATAATTSSGRGRRR